MKGQGENTAQNENSPLLLPKDTSINIPPDDLTTSSNTRSRRSYLSYLAFIRACVFCYDIGTVANYFVSANGFLKHIVNAADIPSFLADHKDALDHNLTDLNDKAWQIPLLVICIYFSIVLCITHEKTVPERLYRLYGRHVSEPNKSSKRGSGPILNVVDDCEFDQDESQPAKNSNENVNCCTKTIILGLSAQSALWKTFIQSTSLLALLAMIPFTGAFWLAFGLSVLFFPGTFMAQASNFIKQIKKDWGWGTFPLRSASTVFFTVGYALTNVGLYFNTINQGPERNGWLEESLTQLPQIGLMGFLLAIQVLFASVFGAQTYKYYKNHIYDLLGKEANHSRQPSYTSGVAQAMNVRQLLSEQRVTYGSMFAAGYKTFSNFLSLAFFVNLLMDIGVPASGGYVLLALLAVSQVFNFYAQLAFYSNDEDEVYERGEDAEVGKLSTFKMHCW